MATPYIEVDITDPAGGGTPLTTYWFIHSYVTDCINHAGEFYWGVYSGLTGGEPDTTTRVLDPIRIGIGGYDYSDPATSTFILTVKWDDVVITLDVMPTRATIFDRVKLMTFRFNDENVDLSTGTIH